MNQSERRQILLRALLDEKPAWRQAGIPAQAGEQKQLLRGLMNVREAAPLSPELLEIQDAYLTAETQAKGITDCREVPQIQPGISLWQGDITTLRCDAIVNAANSGMTGCYIPNHRCIDNCIHTFAGMQLRQECARQMAAQGHPEPTGTARLTPAYNLPCRYILHTVGPIISGPLTDADCQALASCYQSCLDLAAENGLDSVAFCCISTGEFHFPPERAAEIAVDTVTHWLSQQSGQKQVIFNVFQARDKAIYERLLSWGRPCG